MTSISVERITVYLDNSGDKPLVRMRLDDIDYIMMTVKTVVWAARTVKQLEEKPFGIADAMLGIGFDYEASVASGRLVFHPRQDAIGIYVPVKNFESVKMFFNQ
jgi:hypothetical protein